MKGDIGAMLAEAEARHGKAIDGMKRLIEQKAEVERQLGLHRDAALRLEGEIGALRRLKRDEAPGGAAVAPDANPVPPTEPVN